MTVPTRAEIRSGIKRLSGLSPALQAILPRLGDEFLGAQELGSMVNRDPILAARVLRLANSPFYGLPRQVGSLEEAVLILGVSQLRGMVLSTGLIALFSDSEAIARSLATAAAASSLAKSLRQDHGMAFTAGLLHNLGALLLGHFAPELWQSFGDDASEGIESRFQHEKAVFGFDHCELGADIAGDWHFPDMICLAIRLHAQPSGKPGEGLADLVHIAWVIATSKPKTENSLFNPDALRRLGLNEGMAEIALIAASQAAQDSRSAKPTL
ncbi:MAG TPA: HDOD domain-containing protein [Thiobacillus sp.]